mmetsp:Transcript_18273/g.43443  ORF Transcript_18273/g.43443 Transcript_18273/m.43443 type:complete len:235 (-) Transcript_18273:737-1441(-)
MHLRLRPRLAGIGRSHRRDDCRRDRRGDRLHRRWRARSGGGWPALLLLLVYSFGEAGLCAARRLGVRALPRHGRSLQAFRRRLRRGATGCGEARARLVVRSVRSVVGARELWQHVLRQQPAAGARGEVGDDARLARLLRGRIGRRDGGVRLRRPRATDARGRGDQVQEREVELTRGERSGGVRHRSGHRCELRGAKAHRLGSQRLASVAPIPPPLDRRAGLRAGANASAASRWR